MRTALIAALLLLAGCSAGGAWMRADTAPDQVMLDLQTCRGQARARLESYQYYARDRARDEAAAARQIGRSDGTGAVTERWAEAGYRRDRDRLVGDCMEAKGYRRGAAADGRPA